MKRYIILFIILLTITGCTYDKEAVKEINTLSLKTQQNSDISGVVATLLLKKQYSIKIFNILHFD